jgi:hypothetical protein
MKRTLPDYAEIKEEPMKQSFLTWLAYKLIGHNRIFIATRPLSAKQRLCMVEYTEGRAYIAGMPKREYKPTPVRSGVFR